MATTTDAGEWTGPVGDVWAEEWPRTDRSFADLARRLDRVIQDRLSDGKRVADVGSGAGATSIAAATARPDAQIIGFDISPSLVAIARERASHLSNCSFVAGPVQEGIGAKGPFDLIVSRHGVMFFDDPVAGLSAMRAAAGPKGSLVFSCFRAARLNAWAAELVAAIQGAPPPLPAGYEPGPFAFADETYVRGVLEAAGWSDIAAEPVDFVYRAGGGDDPVADAVHFFRRIGPAARALRDADPQAREGIIDRVAEVCAKHLKDGAVEFAAAAWIWTARNPG